jgi:hypothetical protein
MDAVLWAWLPADPIADVVAHIVAPSTGLAVVVNSTGAPMLARNNVRRFGDVVVSACWGDCEEWLLLIGQCTRQNSFHPHATSRVDELRVEDLAGSMATAADPGAETIELKKLIERSKPCRLAGRTIDTRERPFAREPFIGQLLPK